MMSQQNEMMAPVLVAGSVRLTVGHAGPLDAGALESIDRRPISFVDIC